MRKIALFIVVVVTQCLGNAVYAQDLKRSGKNDSWDNPFVSYGYNPTTKIITGYLAALRTAPGRTDACKLVFTNSVERADVFSVTYIRKSGTFSRPAPIHRRVFLVDEGDNRYLKFPKKELEGDCDWILPFVVEMDVSENNDYVLVAIEAQNFGKWISVYAISADRAQVYNLPDSKSVQNAFVLKGDVVYVYEEKPDWYYVKYDEGKRKIEGWIKKADTLQP